MDSRRNFVRYNRTMPTGRVTTPAGMQTTPVADCGTLPQINGYTLAMVYSPVQCFGNLYDLNSALMNGTLFKELNMPFAPGKRC